MAQRLTTAFAPPASDQCELTLFGPGYGECVAMHIGGGDWVVVDSYCTRDGSPAALRYLEEMDVDPAQAVALVVATHWHDDHIRGLAQILKACPAAQFCAAGVLCQKEFSTLMSALEGQHFSASGSGLRELFRVFTLLRETRRKPIHAVANRLVHRTDSCRLWSLSPSDDVFQKFLSAVGNLVPSIGGNKRRIPSLSHNEAAVVLWVECGESKLLLGSDLERKGWVAIAEDETLPTTKASAFKVPHHGSENAHVPAVWKQMLQPEPVAVLAPWRRGLGQLPTAQDAERILQATPHAWVTSKTKPGPFKHEIKAVERTLRESGAHVRRLAGSEGRVRLRRSMGSDEGWTVEAFGSAGRLLDYAA